MPGILHALPISDVERCERSERLDHRMNFSAALIAGGRSRRMGRDKAFLDWNGQPLWRVQLEKLAALKPKRLFLAAREEQNFASELLGVQSQLAIELVNDPAGEDCGPMAAITRCLSLSRHPLLVLAVDMPMMTSSFLRERLLANARDDVGVICRGKDAFEPLAAVYPARALPLFETAMKNEDFALQPIARQLAAEGISTVIELFAAEEALFANANSMDEWGALRDEARK